MLTSYFHDPLSQKPTFKVKSENRVSNGWDIVFVVAVGGGCVGGVGVGIPVGRRGRSTVNDVVIVGERASISRFSWILDPQAPQNKQNKHDLRPPTPPKMLI